MANTEKPPEAIGEPPPENGGFMKALLYGGLGGIAPSLLDLAGRLSGRDLTPWFDGTSNLLLALLGPLVAYAIYFLIGGVVASALGEHKPAKAIVLGVSAPAMISSFLSDASGPGEHLVAELFDARPAFAQGNELLAAKKLKVVIPRDEPAAETGLTYQFQSPDGRALGGGTLAAPGEWQLQVPDGSDAVVLYGSEVNPEVVPLSPGTPGYTVGIERNYWNDLYRSLGKRSVRPYDFSVKPLAPVM